MTVSIPAWYVYDTVPTKTGKPDAHGPPIISRYSLYSWQSVFMDVCMPPD